MNLARFTRIALLDARAERRGIEIVLPGAMVLDGIDPGTTSIATCGLMACNTISTGDDHIALKGGHWISDVTIAHNHFGTGHGDSLLTLNAQADHGNPH